MWEATIHIGQLAASLGVATVIGVAAKAFWDRYRWRLFKQAVRDWLSVDFNQDVDHPKMMTNDEWCALMEQLLSDANFGPFEKKELMELALTTARGVAATTLV